MKKKTILMIFLYAAVTIISIVFVIINSLNLDLKSLLADWLVLEQFILSLLAAFISLTFLLLLVWMILDDNSKRHLNQNLKRILLNQAITQEDDTELGKNVNRLSRKMQQLTNNLQKTENTYIASSQEIVKKERKRIARDLHDTVSQELFASSMILSGVSHNLDQLEKKQLQTQLLAIEDMLNNAQNDLRVLLLHLRPTELEGKTLSEGLAMILRELTDKSNIEIVYKEDIGELPKTIESNFFRIAQEFISNTLKHAKASRLEVYLYQTSSKVQLKMIDDGIGFDMDVVRDLSYGLKNIEDRVNDLAGTVKFLSAENKGVVMDIHVPIMKGDADE
ncbi:envelope stress sensor histidine kinase LiaS [Streptococcus mutans]|uniref:sensor histidine kinase n=1 Tax=Streptococcus mutans TaxID=1309 RepID=UPI000264EFFC|nr:sensor histidine kinase [Streptococcus mutans]EMB57436.1 putative histidine kinase [Streptococcus mutans NLML8]EMB85308.1 putative histidine kinase [Streptococcus mutans A9]EMC02198.1 putative histidine kinase [Streptococcus mutans N34]EMC12094.1 putative histidine kinase [Streptococcus mutans M2A]EMC20489.1 putative histidine kinase [Streptococcus mutans SF1]